MKFHLDKKYVHWGLTAFSVVAASMLFYFGIFHMDTLLIGLRKIYAILTPIIYAAVLSYLLWPLVRFFEKKIIYRFCTKYKLQPSEKVKKIIRMACIILAMFLFIWLIYGLLSMLIPEIVTSVMNIVDSFPRYLNNIEKWISDLLKDYPEYEDTVNVFFSGLFSKTATWLSNDFLPQLNEFIINFSTSFLSIVSFLKNILVGAMISIYMLYGKERYVAHGKKYLYCFFEAKTVNNIIRDLQYIDSTFGGFIVGKLLDSLIIGILCYAGTTILNLPYALLISVVVGVTNVIPFFGPFIGAIPSAFLVLMVNPIQCLYFVVFILALQQFDGNFLGPKILGESTGLSSFMVIVAILVGSGLFGFVGMFVGVPVCAVICTLFRNLMSKKLKKKKLPDNVEYYINIDHLDAKTLEPVYHNTKKSTSEEVFSSYRKQDLNEIEENTDNNQ